MAFEFDDESKQVQDFKPTIPFGVSEVQFVGAIADQTDAGKEFIEVGVVNKEGVEDAVRLWFVSTQSGNISFNTIRQILVHAAKDEKAKDEARTAADAVKDSQELCDLMNDRLAGAKFWMTKYYDAKRTYEAQDGQTRRSINKNIYGYEPKLKPELMPKPADENGNAVDKTFPGATPVDASETVPDDWSK